MTKQVDLVHIDIFCPFPDCGVRHVDENNRFGNYADEPHDDHLCLKKDGGCGRRFKTPTKTIGIAAPPKALFEV